MVVLAEVLCVWNCDMMDMNIIMGLLTVNIQIVKLLIINYINIHITTLHISLEFLTSAFQ